MLTGFSRSQTPLKAFRTGEDGKILRHYTIPALRTRLPSQLQHPSRLPPPGLKTTATQPAPVEAERSTRNVAAVCRNGASRKASGRPACHGNLSVFPIGSSKARTLRLQRLTPVSPLWAFHRSGSFKERALHAVNLGDDADTTGAIYGQLAGAYYSIS